MNVDKYLKRIKCEELREAAPSLANLRKLHKHHLIHIRFENTDIALGVPITSHLPAIYTKIVLNEGRGGVCYELNLLFNWLLTQLGYSARLVECFTFSVVTRTHKSFHTHIAMLVDNLCDSPATYLADVGYPLGYTEPLLFEFDTVQKDLTGTFVLSKASQQINQEEANNMNLQNESQNFVKLSYLRKYDNEGDEATYTWTSAYLIDLAEVNDLTKFDKPLIYVQSPACARLYNRTQVIRYAGEQILIFAGYHLTRVFFC
jgi:N-hydroxyarylamine O-acetyltransferase